MFWVTSNWTWIQGSRELPYRAHFAVKNGLLGFTSCFVGMSLREVLGLCWKEGNSIGRLSHHQSDLLRYCWAHIISISWQGISHEGAQWMDRIINLTILMSKYHSINPPYRPPQWKEILRWTRNLFRWPLDYNDQGRIKMENISKIMVTVLLVMILVGRASLSEALFDDVCYGWR